MTKAFACIDWSSEYLDGLVLVALLRSEGFDASLAHENFVRQNWFHVFAYGGYRVMVPSTEMSPAMALLAAYRGGELALIESSIDTPACPRCAGLHTYSDPWPRRQVFLLFMVCAAVGEAFLIVHSILGGVVNAVAAVTLTALPLAAPLFPGVLRWHVLRRYRCNTCTARWRAPIAADFARLQRDAQT